MRTETTRPYTLYSPNITRTEKGKADDGRGGRKRKKVSLGLLLRRRARRGSTLNRAGIRRGKSGTYAMIPLMTTGIKDFMIRSGRNCPRPAIYDEGKEEGR